MRNGVADSDIWIRSWEVDGYETRDEVCPDCFAPVIAVKWGDNKWVQMDDVGSGNLAAHVCEDDNEN